MANLFAIHSVGDSLASYLNRAYMATRNNEPPCAFSLLSSSQMNELSDPEATMVSIFLYRIAVNEYARNGVLPIDAGRRLPPLSLDLHYLISVWSGSALSEQLVLAWMMRELHQHPILDRSLLSASGGWAQGEYVQLIPTEIADADLMRIWDALAPAYRISVPYVARVVRIDADSDVEFAPVVATRFAPGVKEEP
jgi:hypothetical protein